MKTYIYFNNNSLMGTKVTTDKNNHTVATCTAIFNLYKAMPHVELMIRSQMDEARRLVKYIKKVYAFNPHLGSIYITASGHSKPYDGDTYDYAKGVKIAKSKMEYNVYTAAIGIIKYINLYLLRYDEKTMCVKGQLEFTKKLVESHIEELDK